MVKNSKIIKCLKAILSLRLHGPSCPVPDYRFVLDLKHRTNKLNSSFSLLIEMYVSTAFCGDDYFVVFQNIRLSFYYSEDTRFTNTK